MEELIVSDVMVKEVVTLNPSRNLEDAYLIMKRERVGSLPIVENKKVVGIITRYDLKKYPFSKYPQILIRDVMSTDISSISLDSPVSEAQRIMNRRRIRSIIVRDEEDHLLGIITDKDIKRFKDYTRFRARESRLRYKESQPIDKEPSSRDKECDELDWEPKKEDVYETDEVFINESPYQKNPK